MFEVDVMPAEQALELALIRRVYRGPHEITPKALIFVGI
jgi:hypothetical protein